MAVDPARAKTLFLEASDLASPEERTAYLDRECAEPELRASVEALLAAGDGTVQLQYPDATGVFEQELAATQELSRVSVQRGTTPSELATGAFTPGEPAATIADAPPVRSPGRVTPGRVIAGRYTLLKVLGEGGMGAVYRAEQSQPVKRQVALKLIKTGMDSRTVLARFDAERQALALMDHPSIARVYDGGATEDNQPFFVMELVRGVPITDYCDQHRLPVRARLELFVSVCQAVQHAHQKGIIHRDLKPGNILVTEVDGRPSPKVIDFGVAKATDFDLTDQSLADAGAIVGTPAYMSPEQADPSSMDIDTRTDIYALGVILYELLAGSPPIDTKQFKRGAILEMLRTVREVDPPRPSTRVSHAETLLAIAAGRSESPEHLKRALRGDLDWIVMKAIEKDRTRRYETASGFAADILRHLVHEPVVAAPPSQVYRVRKFVRKHRGGVIAAGLVLLALLAGIGGTTWGLIEARRQELEAKRQETIARSETLEKEKARQAESMRAEGERRATQKALAAALAEKKAKETAEAAEEAGRKLLYTTDMRLAPFLWSDDRTTAEHLRELLRRHIPERPTSGHPDVSAAAAKPDLRGFEWYYFEHLLDHSATVFAGDGATVVDGAFAAEGQLITLDQNGRVRRWDLGSQVEDDAHRHDLLDGRAARGGILSPDGRLAALAQGDVLRVFETATGKESYQLAFVGNRYRHAIFSTDDDRLVIVDDRIRWCDARSGTVIASLDLRFDRVQSCALSADGLTLAVVGHDANGNRFSCFRLDTTTRRVTPLANDVILQTGGGQGASALSPDGELIAVGGSTVGELSVNDTATGRAISIHRSAHSAPIWAIAFSADGEKLATADAAGTIKIWTDAHAINSKSVALMTLKGHVGAIETVRFSLDGKRLASGGGDRTARVWELGNAGGAIQPLERGRDSLAARFSPDGLLIAGAGQSAVRLWDATTGRLVRQLPAGDDSLTYSVAFSPTDPRLLAVGHGGRSRASHVALWDIDAGRELARLPGATDLPDFPLNERSGAVVALAFSPDGRYLVAGFGRKDVAPRGQPYPLKVWDVTTRRLIHRLDGHTGASTSLQFTSDGTLLASGSLDGTAILWSTANWTRTRTLQNPDAQPTTSGPIGVGDLAISPDARTLAMASRTGNLHLWDLTAGTLLETHRVHSNVVGAMAFSPDGRTLASGGRDQTVRLWSAQTRRELFQLNPGSLELSLVTALAFSPDGKHLLAADLGSTCFWSAAPLLWSDPTQAADKLRLLLQSNADFRSRIRMLSENLRLHEALEKLDAGDVRVQAALAATRANWLAARQAWPEAALAFDRLVAADPVEPEAWLRTPGLLRLATALLHQDRPADAARLLQGGAARRTEDGLPAISRANGVDDATGAPFFRLLAALEKRLADDPRNAGLLELRAELDRQGSDFATQAADYTVAIDVRAGEAAAAGAVRVPLGRLYRRRGDAYVGLRQWQEAIADYEKAQTIYEQALTADPGNDRLAAELAGLLLDRPESEYAAPWTVLKPMEMKSETGAELELEKDDSIFAHQNQPFNSDTYSLIFSSGLKRIKRLRLEVLADSRLPQGGPGWGANGNFLLNELTLEAAPAESPDRAKAIPLGNATADFSQVIQFAGVSGAGDGNVRGAVDGKGSTGWAVYPRSNQDHTAVFELAEEIGGGEAARLTVRLNHQSVNQNPNLGNLGRFRLSVSRVLSDSARNPERTAAANLANPWARLAAAYHLAGQPQAALRVIAEHPAAADANALIPVDPAPNAPAPRDGK